ncbi:hypothetical protein [Syntrophotalea acetylenica]|jgi:hypothetical protein|uniref:Uncharacterized protein n=1 Tax=Syntrophotalea acetylenica TaxID=29542 RepID=A0A1L3GFE4_SYNAC|nr:hypothetical protein [Syntrophotalea acetylenica]APG24673.1 hypothetical protein A7E75_06260 [Syntrophotalea acetylenica]APG42724.1 hypothetical protein A6070_00185 [Syntrophotalea acetylenica]MDY0262165.1 hypothetical protein [Syntrophotalea acetylenica]
MNINRFKVVFTGCLAPGMSHRKVRANLEKMRCFPPAALERFFSEEPVVRSGVDAKAAWRCWNLFRKAGALCRVEPMSSTIPPEDRVCPYCNSLQAGKTTCRRCGIDMAMYSLAPHRSR